MLLFLLTAFCGQRWFIIGVVLSDPDLAGDRLHGVSLLLMNTQVAYANFPASRSALSQHDLEAFRSDHDIYVVRFF